ncbi:MAG: PKD domain-containing protein [Thermoanaerobaculia bacterium]
MRSALRPPFTLVLVLLVAVAPLLGPGDAYAFCPNNSWLRCGALRVVSGPATVFTHEDMTRTAVTDLYPEFFPTITPTNEMAQALTQIVEANGEVELNQFLSAWHFDGENLSGGQKRLVDIYGLVVTKLQKNDGNGARQDLGHALHTLQDFYAHSNWIEMSGGVNPDLGVPGHSLGGLDWANEANRSVATCNSCLPCGLIGFTNACSLNLVTSQLTSGYFGSEDRAWPNSSKCLHGGPFDSTVTPLLGLPWGGINKDTPDCYLSPRFWDHSKAAEAATEATKQFLRQIKKAVTGQQLRLLLGVSGTLAFAIDTTGSMGPIIAGVLAEATSIVNGLEGTDQEPTLYVLAPFNDPTVGPVYTTQDAEAFKSAIAGLTASGGGDCPEPSMQGMLQALGASTDNGTLFLYTDADPKDADLEGDVDSLAVTKKIHINATIYGNCDSGAFIKAGEGNVARYFSNATTTRQPSPVYLRVATATGGQVFPLAQSEASNITSLAKFMLRSNLVTLLRVDDTLSTAKTYTFPVDSTVSEITVSISGSTAGVLKRPNGSTVKGSDAGVTLTSLSTGALYDLTGPAPGDWSVTINAGVTFSLAVTGVSPLNLTDFQFVRQAGRPGHQGSFPLPGYPSAGGTSDVRAEMTPGFATAQFEFRGQDGGILSTLTMTQATEPPQLQFNGSATLPSGGFLIYVTGLDSKGKHYQRALRSTQNAESVTVEPPAGQNLHPGVTTNYVFQVKNQGSANTFTVKAGDERGYVSSVSPSTLTLGAGATASPIVQMIPPTGAADGTTDILTFSVSSTAPAGVTNFATVLSTVVSGTSPAVTAVDPTSGSVAGGTSLNITGSGFVTGASAVLGGVLVTEVAVVSGTKITGKTGAHAPGMVELTVFNPDGESGTLPNAFTYTGTAVSLSMSVTPATIAVGDSAAGQVVLSQALASSVPIGLASSNATVASVPLSLTIAAGSTSASFSVTGVAAGGPVTITATLPASLGGGSVSAPVTVGSTSGSSYVFSHLAGSPGGAGQADGTGSAARFSYPWGVTVDGSGNLYVADTFNQTIRKVTPAGVVTTLAGLAGTAGSTDGTGSAARFSYPYSVAADGAGNVYVADAGNDTIRKVTSAGVVTTLAGLAGSTGSNDGTGSAARFNDPWGIAVDGSGNVYVADGYNQTIRKITPAGVVSTLAGLAGTSGSVDGTGSAARFHYPGNVAVDGSGNVYVADTDNQTIRKVTPAGVVTTLAGLAGNEDSVDGTGSAARFSYPEALAVDGSGNLYVADSGNNTVRKVTPAGVVTTLAGLAGSFGSADGTGSTARFNAPGGVTVDGSGNVWVADTNNQTIRKMTPAGVVTTPVGPGGGIGSTDGTGSAARFDYPEGLAVDGSGNVYVADTFNQTIRKVTSVGVVTTLAGLPGTSGTADGVGSAALFGYPYGVASDSGGNLYVADWNNQTIRKVTPGGAVTTLAGLPLTSGSADGTGNSARFNAPRGIAVDGSGNAWVADTANQTIRKVTPAGAVTTVAGLAGTSGSADGTGSAARFYSPSGVAVDGSGNIFVADTANQTIRKVTPAGVVTTLAGLAGSSGSVDGTGSAARFYNPRGIAVDGSGNVYVAEADNDTIRKVTPAGVVTTVAGLAGIYGSADGPGGTARFNGPQGIAVDAAGNLYVADTWNHAIRKGTSSALAPPVADFSFNPGAPTAGQTVQFSDASTGGATSWAWTFDDGGTSALQNPTHVYASAGSYSVSLTATNAGGSNTATKSVVVRSAGSKLGDFTGEGKASVAVYRPGTGVWYPLSASGSWTATTWGIPGDVPVPADSDGDGMTNVAVYRPSTGVWYVRRPNGSFTATAWGVPGDVPVPADYDGDGKADPAVFRPSTGTWFVLKSTGGWTSKNWGMSGDEPVAGDFDGDGKGDYAVVRDSGGVLTWFVSKSSTGYASYDAVQWGVSGDIPVPADYDGDGKTDIAVFRPSSGWWYIKRSSDGGVTARQWGVSGDIAQPADYDGDGKADIAIYRPSNGGWWVIRSSDGAVLNRTWGISGDVPVAAPRY